MLEETWAVIRDFPDYAISSYGFVKNIRFNAMLRPRANSYGLLRVSLMRDGQKFDCYVHQLVAKEFLTGWRPGIRVKHYDGDNGNNHIDNLRFISRGTGYLRKDLESPEFRHIRIQGTGQVFRTVADLARYLDGDPSKIYAVLRGDRRSHLGHTFEYIRVGAQ